MKTSCFSAKTLASLIVKEPLIGHYLDNSEIIETSHLPENVCAGITIQSGNILLYINPKRFNLLSEEEKAGVIVHELIHVLLGHVSDRGVCTGKKAKVLNIAQDMSINQMILKSGLALPSYVIMHNTGEYNLKPLQSSEFYYNELISDIPKFIRHFGELDDSNNDSEVNNHNDWSKSESDSKFVIERIAAEYIDNGHSQVGGVLGGTEYANILSRINIINKSQVNWISEIRQYLHYIIVRENRSIDYKRPSRRQEDPDFIFPGRKRRSKKYKAALVIDVSGSMKNVLPYVMGEVNKLASFIKLDVYFCDTKVTQTIENYTVCKDVEIIGYGGTSLQPAFTKAKKDGAKTIICFSDGYLQGDLTNISNINVVWGIYNNPTFFPTVGKVVRIEV